MLLSFFPGGKIVGFEKGTKKVDLEPFVFGGFFSFKAHLEPYIPSKAALMWAPYLEKS